MLRHLRILLWLCCLLPLVAQANVGRDPFLATAQECTRHLPTMERLYNIPAHWLAAIASTESGRYHSQLRISVPWPWTINVAGKGYWFNSKQEAVAAVEGYQARGIKSIDVGCMQVNLHYHGKNFASVSQAFEPLYNIAYAAKFLREHYNNSNSWTKATAAYHSMQARRGADYYRKVYKKWQQVVDRLNDAMFTAAPSQQVLRAPEPPLQSPTTPTSSFAYRNVPSPFKIATPSDGGLMPQQQVRMNSIKVTRGTPAMVEPKRITVTADSFAPQPSAPPVMAALAPSQPPVFEAPAPVNNRDVLPLPEEAITALDAASLSNTQERVTVLDSPPARQYERGVMVIRPKSSKLSMTVETTAATSEAPVSKGQFAPAAVGTPPEDGGYVANRPAPKTVSSPKFVF